MIKAKAAFIVYGVHKDGLKDPMGGLFIDDGIIEKSKKALVDQGIELIENDLVVATKQEAKQVICSLAKDDGLDCLVLFSGTWIWAANMVGAIREFAKTGKGIIIWTYPGSQGWRPVGGLVLKAALKEVGIRHRYVYGRSEDKKDLDRVVSYIMASAVKNRINMSTMGAFGGRGMGQTCGVADPSQWMKIFGIDIDSRDTTELINTAESVSRQELDQAYEKMEKKFRNMPVQNDVTERSIRLYIAIKKLLKKNCFDFYTIQSFPGLADDYVASCFAQSMILDDGIPTSTLSDFNTAMTSILMIYLGSERVYYGDFQCIDKTNNEIKIIGDGAIPPSLANKYGAGFAQHGIPTEGGAGGLSVEAVCKKGRGVLGRICRVDGQFRLVVAKCTVTEPSDDEIEARRKECGIPFWPHAFVTVDADMDALLENWDNEYACLGYGDHLYQQMLDFAELVGIDAIAL
ncbi:MAG: hypothetical protein JW760_09495 [Spirochaetales bacterium]|nr:hypothetical protein [Spirochaetales bacterium]